MTCGKTRQKRNGPGGSGCFHAFCYFLGRPARGLCEAGAGRRGLGARFLAKPCSSVPLAPSSGAFSGTGRRAGRGASLPAIPCSFVDGHHVFGAKGAAGEPDVVPHSPQSLALSSTGTTFPEPERPAGDPGVVLHPPHTLALSSTGTTSLEPDRSPASRTWCLTPRNPLFFRRRAPRFPNRRGPMRAGRGASLPAKPCSFVDEHHVFEAKGAAGEPDVVPHSPQSLVLSSTGTTSLEPKAPPAARPASSPIIIIPRGKELTTNALYLPLRRQF